MQTITSKVSARAAEQLRGLLPLTFLSALTVLTACGTSSQQSTLALSGISPASGSTAGNNQVTLSGSGLSADTQVMFGSSPAQIVSANSAGTSLVAVAPAEAAGPVQVVVTQSSTNRTSNGYIYTYIAPSSGSSSSGSAGSGSSSSSSSGSASSGSSSSGSSSSGSTSGGAGSSSGGSTSTGSSSSGSSSSGSSSSGSTSSGSGSGSSGSGGSTTLVTALSGISPASGAAQQTTNVTITGSNFQAGSQVRVGASYATNVNVVSSTKITATLPAMGAGAYTVEIVSPNNAVASLNNAFTYLAALTVATSSLPNATVGKVYSASLAATGGIAPYVWSISSGALPAGLTLSSGGQFAGASTKAGTGTFTVSVKDSTGTTASEPLSLVTAAGTSSGGTPTGTGLTACQAINTSGSYYLENNVTCTTQGFAINANNVTLNLNGYTITYGNPNSIVPAISICDTWYSLLPTTACGNGQHASPTITNGSIVQSTSAAPFTHAIWIGQANGLNGGTISNLTITIQQTGTQAIHGDYAWSGWTVENNTVNDNVTNIQQPGQSPLGARSQFQGVAIDFGDGGSTTSGDTFTGNTINGSPQGGFLDSSADSTFTNNVITLSSSYSNDYGIALLANGQTASGNVISGRGRGIDAEVSDFTITGNSINVHEEANNSEYDGCELAGSDGIRVKQYVYGTISPETITSAGVAVPAITGWVISNNNITVDGTYCEANGITLSNMTTGVSGSISRNNFNVTAANSSQQTDGILFNSAQTMGINWVNNSFRAPQYCAVIGDDGDMWPSADTTVQAGQAWSCGTTVYDTDLQQTISNGPTEALTLQDTFSSPSVVCGPYSTALVTLGSYTKQCP